MAEERVVMPLQNLFPLGHIVCTPGVPEAGIPPWVVSELLQRHANGDWGKVSPSDARANQAALKTGERLVSVYEVKDGSHTLYIITEADRSATTIMFPDEY